MFSVKKNGYQKNTKKFRTYCEGSRVLNQKVIFGVLNKGEWGVSGSLKFLCFFCNHFCVLKTSKNAMKHMILSFKMKRDVISDLFLMQWFPKDFLDTVGFED